MIATHMLAWATRLTGTGRAPTLGQWLLVEHGHLWTHLGTRRTHEGVQDATGAVTQEVEAGNVVAGSTGVDADAGTTIIG